jgi:hypothetical protein
MTLLSDQYQLKTVEVKYWKENKEKLINIAFTSARPLIVISLHPIKMVNLVWVIF